MKHLIDKAAVVAEINRRIEFFSDINNKQVIDSNLDCAIAFAGLRDFLDTIEVKEVNINKEISQFIDANFEKAKIGHKLSLRRTAKHFFELGLKAKKVINELKENEFDDGTIRNYPLV